MGKLHISDLDLHVEQGLVKLTPHPTDPLTLACYTKRCFYQGKWDPISKACRGLVFGPDGWAVNAPLPKIFNLNEQPETQESVILEKLALGTHTVQDKSNGHLAILFYWNGKWYNTTKGSWGHEFISQDRKLLEPFIESLDKDIPNFRGLTYMFEIIADYDKHTMYEHETKRYSDNCAVMLTAYSNESGIEYSMSQYVDWGIDGIYTCEWYLPQSVEGLSALYKHKDREGYVISFEDGEKVKVKCEDYLFLRYQKEMEGGAKMKKLFKQYFTDVQGARSEIPEEYYYLYDELLNEFQLFSCNELSFFACKVEEIEYNAKSEKDVAEAIKSYPDEWVPFLFSMWRGKTPYQALKRKFIETNDFSYR